MMARLEITDVSLTARMGDVFHRFRYSVLAGNTTFAEFYRKSVVVQARQPRRLGQRQPAPRIIATGQLDLHVPLPLAGPEWQARERFLVEIESDAHKGSLACLDDPVKRYPTTPNDLRRPFAVNAAEI